jgi:MFS family permease
MAIRALLGLALSVGLMGYAHSAPQLLLLRMLQGATGGFVAACIALVGTSVPKDRLGSALGFLQSGVIAGHFVGPLLGGLMADQVGFRNVFRITGGILVLVAVLVALAVREEYVPDERARRSSYFDNFRMLGRSVELRALFLVIFFSQAGMMMLNPLMSLLVKELPHDPAALGKLVGLVTAAPALTSFAAAPLWGRLGDTRGPHRVLVIALGACALIYPWGALSIAVWHLFMVRFCLGAFTSAISPTAHSLVGRSADPSRAASAFSLMTSAQMTGSAIGPFVGGPLATAFGIRSMFLITAVMMTAAALGAVRLRRLAVPSVERAAEPSVEAASATHRASA